MFEVISRRLSCFILIILCSYQIFGQVNNKIIEITSFFETEYFYWGEYTDNSIQIVEEAGLLYGGGVSAKIKFSKSIELYSFIEPSIYYGIVSYSGFLQDGNGNTEYYKSESAYLGTKITLNLGYDIYVSRKFILAPEFGFQYEYWNRDVNNGGQYGYDEKYNLFILDFGFNVIIPFSRSSKLFLCALGEYPISISESIDFTSRGHSNRTNLILEPNPNIGLNIELGANIYSVFISAYLDYMLLSKSPFNQNYFQPESDRSLIGLKLGYSF